MKKEKKIIWGIFILAIMVWLLDLWLYPYQNPITLFTLRSELTNLTGIIAFFFMGLIMVLAVRPKWLEKVFGGLDKMYYIHKWAGIIAISAGGLHYLVRLSKNILKHFAEKGPKEIMPTNYFSPIHDFLIQYKGISKDLGEYMIWGLLIILAITLWKKIPYRFWRYTHKVMGAIFLVIVFHTLVLTPVTYWVQPAGIAFLIISIVGSICAFISLFGLIGKKRTFKGEVINIQHEGDMIEIVCQLEEGWAHKAGQYAFFLHDKLEGAHPFTISSHDHHNNQIRFSIKSLGDYTNYLSNRVKVGDEISVEGPYGLFDYQRSKSDHQVWIGGGIGVTPFIAWLEAMNENVADNELGTKADIDFYYSVRNKKEGVYAKRLTELCKNLPSVTLHIHYSDEKGHLSIDNIPVREDAKGKPSEFWFCGPNGFASSLKKTLKTQNYPINRQFHQEIFEMR